MKIARSRITVLAGLAAIALTATSAHAAVILASNFNGVDTTTQDFANGSALGITWDTVAGITTPSSTLPFSGTDGFFPTANEISVDRNLVNEGPWSTSIILSLDPSTSAIDLTQLSFNWRVTGNTGGSGNSQSKTTTWTVAITGSTSGSLGSPVANSGGTGNPTQLRNIDLSSFSTLTSAETYTLTLTASGSGFGHNASLQDLSLSGDITAIPEPSAALLGSLGALFLLRRRRN